MTPARRIVSTVVALAATALGGGLPTLTGIAGAQGSAAARSGAAGGGGAEVYRVPPNGVFTFQGHGWGHGHGMSQYGAYGAAKVRGLSYQQIVAFYYPHTTLVGRSRSTVVKVLMHGTADRDLVVAPRTKAPMTVTTTASNVPACTLPTTLDGGKTTVTRWRARRVSTADGQRLLVKGSSDGTSWSTAKSPTCDAAWAKPLDGSVTFTSGAITNLARSGGVTPYRGSLRAAFTGTRIFVVNVVRLESYLRSVVPSEMPSSWSSAALQAQAVAARTYASYEIAHPKNKPYYDVYDDTRDQMYVGVRGEAATSTAAVLATQDPKADTAMVLQDSAGHAAFTQFSSSDGGWTVSGGQPYLPAHRDPYDGLVPSSVHSWTSTIAASSLSSAFAGQIGSVRSIVVTGRDGHGQWGGRVTSLTLHGTDGDVSLSGSTFRYDFGLRSEWFRVLLPPARPTGVTAGVAHATATVAWQPPPSVAGHARVTGYRVVLQPSGATRTVGASVGSVSLGSVSSGTRTRATVTGLSQAGPGRGTTVTSKVHRLAAGNRAATAVAVSRATFAAGRAGAVVLARQATTTGLAAAPLAAAQHAPVLVTGRGGLPASTQAEIRRVLPKGGTVDLVGSVDVIGDGVRAAVRGLGYKVRRYGGANPAAVARTIARRLAATTKVTSVFEVSQGDPAAAWAASPAAAAAHGVVLLTDGEHQSPETAGWLAQHPEVKTRYAVGAAAAKADPAATPVVGTDDAATSAAVARKFFAHPSRAAVVGHSPGLAGLVAAARLSQTHGPVLVAYRATLPSVEASYITGKHASLQRVDLVGGRLPYNAVESGVQRALLG